MLRRATLEDESFLFDLRKSTMHEHLARAGESIDDRQHWERVRYRFNDAHIVCRGPERLGLFKFSQDANEWTIVQIQISPPYQGLGIAGRLLHDFLRQADNARVPVKLSVLKGNPAINLYQRLGFKVIDTTDISLQMKR